VFLLSRSGDVLSHTKQEATALAFSPDGQYLAIGRSKGRQVAIWSPSSQRTLRLIPTANRDISACGFSPAGTRFFEDSGQPTLWDVASRQSIGTFPAWALSMAFVGEDRVLSADQEGLGLWEIAPAPHSLGNARGTKVASLYPGLPVHFVVSQAGTCLAVGENQKEFYSVVVQNLPDGAVRFRLGPRPLREMLVFDTPWGIHKARVSLSADGSRLAVAWVSEVEIYDAHSGALLSAHAVPAQSPRDWVYRLALRPDGRQFACTTNQHKLWLSPEFEP
jgi:WD40 repeat protein